MAATMRRRKTIDKNVERKIIIGLITSTRVCNEILPFCSPDYFDLSFCRKLAEWIKNYHESYNEAPYKHISDIYDHEKGSLTPEDNESIQEFLVSLSEQFQNEGLNEDYAIETARVYLKKQAIIKHCTLAQALANDGDIQGAEKAILKWSSVPSDTKITWVNPFNDEDFFFNVFNQKDNILFELDGGFGRLLGPLKREWLVALMGPMKRGKTWLLQHFAMTAVYHRLRVLFISCEMGNQDLANRFYRQLVSLPDDEGMTYYPVYDCELNQNNTCERSERPCRESVPEDPNQESFYQPCSACRGNGTDSFKATVWGSYIHRTSYTSNDVRKAIEALRPQIGYNRLRLISYPAFAANIQNVMTDIDLLEIREGFIPDVIVLDYADILAPEKASDSGRDKIDATWKSLKRMASERKCLVVTASQTNRDSIEKAIIDEQHTAEDIRKLAHVDIMMTLNQTPFEKMVGGMRISVLEHRWKQFDKFTQALLLQNYATGQASIDSEITRFNPDKYKKKKKKKDEEE